MNTVCEVVDLGMTGWCSTDRHQHCAHRPGGSQEHGVWLPECYLTIPKGRQRVCTLAQAAVIRPSHVYHCPCECHTADPVGQLELFGVAL